ncbi:hypothetical protein J6590_059574 [Homalodisca vitripennis]|nr:hypothetical protein J6590_059574 [Homalodisca vitripennis]
MDLLSPWLTCWRSELTRSSRTNNDYGPAIREFLTIQSDRLQWPISQGTSRMVLTRSLLTKVAATRRIQTGWDAFMSDAPLFTVYDLYQNAPLHLDHTTITYVGPVWYTRLAATPRKQLESFQHRAVRFLPETRWFDRNNDMMRSFGIPTLSDYIKTQTRDLFDSADSSFDAE